MVQAFTVTRVVDHPADEVWRQLTDWDRAAGWLGVDSIRADGPTEVGTTLRFVTRGKERTSEIAALEPGRSITLRSRQGGVTADYRYTVEPAGDASRVSLAADVRTSGVWALAGPLIRTAIRRTDAGQLDALDRELTGR
jgi:carbon monoxide dehydrogenase subunit G